MIAGDRARPTPVPSPIRSMPTPLRTLAAAVAALAVAAAPAAARAQLQTLTFEGVPTAAAAGHTGPLAALGAYQFFNFRVMSTSESFGSGANASSGVRFAYAGPGSASIYRTDAPFGLVSAFLSFRTYDGRVDPVDVVVRGWGAGPDPLYERTLTLGNTAQRFDFGFVGLEEVEFDGTALRDGRSAVLAVDDVTLGVVPEPGTVVLVASGLVVVLAGAARRRARGA